MYKIVYTMLNGNKHVEGLRGERAKDTCVEDVASNINYDLSLDTRMKSIGKGKLIRRDHVTSVEVTKYEEDGEDSTVHSVEIVKGVMPNDA